MYLHQLYTRTKALWAWSNNCDSIHKYRNHHFFRSDLILYCKNFHYTVLPVFNCCKPNLYNWIVSWKANINSLPNQNLEATVCQTDEHNCSRKHVMAYRDEPDKPSFSVPNVWCNFRMPVSDMSGRAFPR